MDPNTIIEALRGTMDPALQEAMEHQLNEAHKSLNFVSMLLQITMSEQLDLPVRQMLMRNFGKKTLTNIYA
uniref:Importin N-terminal domain-containing protein n=1 Tax=Gorilla gorilla gorilla TaxID=9595 RepID=A0A2I2Z712_GORGO